MRTLAGIGLAFIAVVVSAMRREHITMGHATFGFEDDEL